jgi:hypothetical protein
MNFLDFTFNSIAIEIPFGRFTVFHASAIYSSFLIPRALLSAFQVSDSFDWNGEAWGMSGTLGMVGQELEEMRLGGI